MVNTTKLVLSLLLIICFTLIKMPRITFLASWCPANDTFFCFLFMGSRALPLRDANFKNYLYSVGILLHIIIFHFIVSCQNTPL